MPAPRGCGQAAGSVAHPGRAAAPPDGLRAAKLCATPVHQGVIFRGQDTHAGVERNNNALSLPRTHVGGQALQVYLRMGARVMAIVSISASTNAFLWAALQGRGGLSGAHTHAAKPRKHKHKHGHSVFRGARAPPPSHTRSTGHVHAWSVTHARAQPHVPQRRFTRVSALPGLGLVEVLPHSRAAGALGPLNVRAARQELAAREGAPADSGADAGNDGVRLCAQSARRTHGRPACCNAGVRNQPLTLPPLAPAALFNSNLCTRVSDRCHAHALPHPHPHPHPHQGTQARHSDLPAQPGRQFPRCSSLRVGTPAFLRTSGASCGQTQDR
jgi:hypothetical protein